MSPAERNTMEAENSCILAGGQIVTSECLLTDSCIVIEDGWITGLHPLSFLEQMDTSLPVLFMEPSHFILPGFIDLHIHGSSGADVMDASEESLTTIAQSLGKQGVTGFLATTMTDSEKHISRVMEVIAGYQICDPFEAKILGIHLEGPFISGKQLGAHSEKWQHKADIEMFNRWQKKARGAIKQVTLAPEEDEDFSLIRYLHGSGVTPSIGHTRCDARMAFESMNAGISHATHLFNAMSGLSHRNPGTAMAVLLNNTVSAELIADGVHLSPEAIRLALAMKGKENIILITDAMRAQGVGEGEFLLGEQIVRVQGKEARLSDGTLAGSVLTMNRALENMIRFTGCDIVDASRMASANPARKLGLHNTGIIEKGKKADLAILDERFQVIRTLTG